MENLLSNKMEESYVYVGSMCGIYGLIFTVCLYQNLTGITFPICVAATIVISVLYLKKMEVAVKRNYLFYAVGMMLLGISTVLTSNAFFHLFNWAGVLLLLMTSMIQQLNDDENWCFQKYVVSILILAGKIITSVFKPITDAMKYNKMRGEESEKSKYWKSIIIGSICAVCLLMIVLPLLVFSDEIFARFFGQFLEIFRFEKAITISLTFLTGFILMYAFLSGISRLVINSNQNKKSPEINSLTGITFTGILAGIYVFYSVIQILFLFLRLDSGLPSGVTYAQYAHSGFWQLLLVSVINFVTVLSCISIFKDHKILKILLFIISICTCIMALSAAYRMMLYVGVYYLSFLRVLVLWFLGVLLLIMLGVMFSIFRRRFKLFKYSMAVVAVSYIVLSFAGVDKIVVSYNLANWEYVNLDDMYGLMYSSSRDVAPYIEEAVKRAEPGYGQSAQTEADQYFQNILNENRSPREWNYSEVRAKKAAEMYFEKKN